MFKFVNTIIIAIVLTGSSISAFSEESSQINWRERLVPLPHESKFGKISEFKADKIALIISQKLTSPVFKTAVTRLKQFCKNNDGKPGFSIRLLLNGKNADSISEVIKSRLKSTKNSSQAYALVSNPDKAELSIVANEPAGLFYGTLTLCQLLKVSAPVPPEKALSIPEMTIIDWPDFAERGQWRWGPWRDNRTRWFADWKLNYCDLMVRCEINKQGKPVLSKRELNRLLKYYSFCETLGIRITPYIAHLGYIFSDIVEPVIRKNPKLKNYLNALRLDESGKRGGGVCPTSKIAENLLTGWMLKIAKVTYRFNPEMEVWLTEGYRLCETAKKTGKKHFQLETEMIKRAFDKVKEKYPKMRLRILLTQGSNKINANPSVIKAAGPETGIVLYGAKETYNCFKQPMIPDYLAGFARKGGFVGVFPMFTASVGCITPWTAPQFVNYRIREFADKKLSTVSGYILPDTRYHEFNLVAMAEWLWNSEGRTPKEFARAYANVTGICEPELFAEWAVLAGETKWASAETNLLLALTRDITLGAYGTISFKEIFSRQFDRAPLLGPAYRKNMLAKARKALKLAKKAKVPGMIQESEITLSLIEAFDALAVIGEIVRKSNVSETERKLLAAKLDQLDKAAHAFRTNVLAWAESKNRSVHRRIRGGIDKLIFVADEMRKATERLRISDPRPESRPVELGLWKARDFKQGKAVYKYKLPDESVRPAGMYSILFNYLDGNKVSVASIKLYGKSNGKRTLMSKSPDAHGNIPIVSSFVDCRLPVPGIAKDTRVELEIELRIAGGHHNRIKSDSCAGVMSVRKLYALGRFPDKLVSSPLVMKPRKQESYKKLFSARKGGGEIAVGLTPGFGSTGIKSLLDKFPGKFTVIPLGNEINADNLSKCNVLLLTQPKSTYYFQKNVPLILRWVKSGGGLMCFHDVAGFRSFPVMFKKIGAGTGHPKQKQLLVESVHPVTKGLPAGKKFNAGFKYDHISLKTGPSGKTLIADEDKNPVIIAGESGKGRVILCGLLTGRAGDRNDFKGRELPPVNEEKQIVLNAIEWLSGEPESTPAPVADPDNLVKNPDVEATIPSKDHPIKTGLKKGKLLVRGWTGHTSAGIGEWGVTDKIAHSGKNSVYLRYLRGKTYKNGKTYHNVGLFLAETDNYSGVTAIDAKPGTTYEFSFWMKGNAPEVSVSVTGWKIKTGKDRLDSPKSREWYTISRIKVDGKLVRGARNRANIIKPTSQWQYYSGTFRTRAFSKKFALRISIKDNPELKPGNTIYVDDVTIKIKKE